MIPKQALVALVPFFLSYTLGTPIDHGIIASRRGGASDVTTNEEVVSGVTVFLPKPHLKQCRAWNLEDSLVHYCLALKADDATLRGLENGYELVPNLVSFDIVSEDDVSSFGGSTGKDFVPFHERVSVSTSYAFDSESEQEDAPVRIVPPLAQDVSLDAGMNAGKPSGHSQHTGCQTCWIAEGWVMEYEGDFLVGSSKSEESTALWKKKFYARVQVCIPEKDGDPVDLEGFTFVKASPEDILGPKYKKKSDLRGHLFFREALSDVVTFCPLEGDDPVSDETAFNLALAAEEEDRKHGFIRGEAYKPKGERVIRGGSRGSLASDHSSVEIGGTTHVFPPPATTRESVALATKTESQPFFSTQSSQTQLQPSATKLDPSIRGKTSEKATAPTSTEPLHAPGTQYIETQSQTQTPQITSSGSGFITTESTASTESMILATRTESLLGSLSTSTTTQQAPIVHSFKTQSHNPTAQIPSSDFGPLAIEKTTSAKTAILSAKTESPLTSATEFADAQKAVVEREDSEATNDQRAGGVARKGRVEKDSPESLPQEESIVEKSNRQEGYSQEEKSEKATSAIKSDTQDTERQNADAALTSQRDDIQIESPKGGFEKGDSLKAEPQKLDLQGGEPQTVSVQKENAGIILAQNSTTKVVDEKTIEKQNTENSKSVAQNSGSYTLGSQVTNDEKEAANTIKPANTASSTNSEIKGDKQQSPKNISLQNSENSIEQMGNKIYNGLVDGNYDGKYGTVHDGTFDESKVAAGYQKPDRQQWSSADTGETVQGRKILKEVLSAARERGGVQDEQSTNSETNIWDGLVPVSGSEFENTWTGPSYSLQTRQKAGPPYHLGVAPSNAYPRLDDVILGDVYLAGYAAGHNSLQDQGSYRPVPAGTEKFGQLIRTSHPKVEDYQQVAQSGTVYRPPQEKQANTGYLSDQSRYSSDLDENSYQETKYPSKTEQDAYQDNQLPYNAAAEFYQHKLYAPEPDRKSFEKNIYLPDADHNSYQPEKQHNSGTDNAAPQTKQQYPSSSERLDTERTHQAVKEADPSYNRQPDFKRNSEDLQQAQAPEEKHSSKKVERKPVGGLARNHVVDTSATYHPHHVEYRAKHKDSALYSAPSHKKGMVRPGQGEDIQHPKEVQRDEKVQHNGKVQHDEKSQDREHKTHENDHHYDTTGHGEERKSHSSTQNIDSTSQSQKSKNDFDDSLRKSDAHQGHSDRKTTKQDDQDRKSTSQKISASEKSPNAAEGQKHLGHEVMQKWSDGERNLDRSGSDEDTNNQPKSRKDVNDNQHASFSQREEDSRLTSDRNDSERSHSTKTESDKHHSKAADEKKRASDSETRPTYGRKTSQADSRSDASEGSSRKKDRSQSKAESEKHSESAENKKHGSKAEKNSHHSHRSHGKKAIVDNGDDEQDNTKHKQTQHSRHNKVRDDRNDEEQDNTQSGSTKNSHDSNNEGEEDTKSKKSHSHSKKIAGDVRNEEQSDAKNKKSHSHSKNVADDVRNEEQSDAKSKKTHRSRSKKVVTDSNDDDEEEEVSTTTESHKSGRQHSIADSQDSDKDSDSSHHEASLRSTKHSRKKNSEKPDNENESGGGSLHKRDINEVRKVREAALDSYLDDDPDSEDPEEVIRVSKAVKAKGKKLNKKKKSNREKKLDEKLSSSEKRLIAEQEANASETAHSTEKGEVESAGVESQEYSKKTSKTESKKMSVLPEEVVEEAFDPTIDTQDNSKQNTKDNSAARAVIEDKSSNSDIKAQEELEENAGKSASHLKVNSSGEDEQMVSESATYDQEQPKADRTEKHSKSEDETTSKTHLQKEDQSKASAKSNANRKGWKDELSSTKYKSEANRTTESSAKETSGKPKDSSDSSKRSSKEDLKSKTKGNSNDRAKATSTDVHSRMASESKRSNPSTTSERSERSNRQTTITAEPRATEKSENESENSKSKRKSSGGKSENQLTTSARGHTVSYATKTESGKAIKTTEASKKEKKGRNKAISLSDEHSSTPTSTVDRSQKAPQRKVYPMVLLAEVEEQDSSANASEDYASENQNAEFNEAIDESGSESDEVDEEADDGQIFEITEVTENEIEESDDDLKASQLVEQIQSEIDGSWETKDYDVTLGDESSEGATLPTLVKASKKHKHRSKSSALKTILEEPEPETDEESAADEKPEVDEEAEAHEGAEANEELEAEADEEAEDEEEAEDDEEAEADEEPESDEEDSERLSNFFVDDEYAEATIVSAIREGQEGKRAGSEVGLVSDEYEIETPTTTQKKHHHRHPRTILQEPEIIDMPSELPSEVTLDDINPSLSIAPRPYLANDQGVELWIRYPVVKSVQPAPHAQANTFAPRQSRTPTYTTVTVKSKLVGKGAHLAAPTPTLQKTYTKTVNPRLAAAARPTTSAKAESKRLYDHLIGGFINLG